MYEYVNGEKGNNIGFAKIAVQNQRYKIKIHVKNFALNGRMLNVYGFVRGDGILYSSCLGSMKMINGIGEGIFVGNTGELWEKYRFLDMGGLILCGASLLETSKNCEVVDKKAALLQQEKVRFCATQWEEGTIMLEQLDIFQNVTQHEEKVENENRGDYKEEMPIERQAVMEAENERKALQAAETDTQYGTDGTGNTQEAEEVVSVAEQQPEKNQVKQSLEAVQESHPANSENNQTEEDIWDLFEQRRKQIQLQFEEIKHAAKEERKEQNKEEAKDVTKWQPGEELLEKFPEMCPFFDNSVSASVRIEPKDIGVLPMEFWYLANNSFLLHGYYCYRHLLFMKMEMEQEKVYAIAVPGNSNYREKFMANMFGFEQFKTVQKKENAGFGYWWKRIF